MQSDPDLHGQMCTPPRTPCGTCYTVQLDGYVGSFDTLEEAAKALDAYKAKQALKREQKKA